MPRLDIFFLGKQGLAIHLEMPFRVERVALKTGGIFRAMAFGTALLTPNVDVLGALRLRRIMAASAFVNVMGVVIEFCLGEPVRCDFGLDDPPGRKIIVRLFGLMAL